MSSKRCGGCYKNKSADLFNWKNRKLGLRHSICKDCHAEYKKQHYIQNRNKYIAKAQKWNGAQRLKLQRIVLNYLREHACADCGEADVLVLDFDHQRNKTKGIAEMIKSSCSEDRILTEIKKCEVRCANCHRRKTAKDRGYWKMGA